MDGRATRHPLRSRLSGSDVNSDRFLTLRWNNALVAGLGLPALVFAALSLLTEVMSERWEFIWLVSIGVVY